ncbi:MAG: hypothetical protein JWM01_575 [Arthrobacter sp.]|jgi:hypothetical protein|nr:hypothetical protein [Arthrobacter sp.]MCU1522773.1 hypothetical protein [Arthrobacter sp.]MCU1539628.1 hypothetical protein [Arthrobacter sp.]MCU1555086.1 hypothetical protein [Arthrobacter sp.]
MITGLAGSGNNGTARSGTASSSLTAEDAGACASRSYEVQLLAARLAACADQAEALLSQLTRIELRGWQSPAGRAYRAALSLQAASLRRSRDTLQDAGAIVLRHAQNVVLSSGLPGS